MRGMMSPRLVGPGAGSAQVFSSVMCSAGLRRGWGVRAFYECFGKMLLPTQALDQDSSTEAEGPQQRHDFRTFARHHHTKPASFGC
eukprot:CAMPEP_0172590874 /NCGR_PEP_ID=MMETSP1068-20121228/9524_1 /TAXON_ID=35684 /ORGANISM="Pseudopedinella elastica, Strain CCMP716" /LENGTH=85 /DNA_ID=CAMNT_0013387015 /DNA_START=371 /DNA_END=628 /DNA_ORIENTATION=+